MANIRKTAIPEKEEQRFVNLAKMFDALDHDMKIDLAARIDQTYRIQLMKENKAG